jgi:hypothetical protein
LSLNVPSSSFDTSIDLRLFVIIKNVSFSKGFCPGSHRPRARVPLVVWAWDLVVMRLPCRGLPAPALPLFFGCFSLFLSPSTRMMYFRLVLILNVSILFLIGNPGRSLNASEPLPPYSRIETLSLYSPPSLILIMKRIFLRKEVAAATSGTRCGRRLSPLPCLPSLRYK